MEPSVPVRPALDASPKRGLSRHQKRPRLTTKKQVSVRIDKQVLQTAKQRAAKQGMDLTDAIEQGLWLYLGEERAEATTQLRFLVTALPLATQKRLLTAAEFMISKELSPVEQHIRSYLTQVFDLFAQDPRAEHALVGFTQPGA
jgi:hypothetical protein